MSELLRWFRIERLSPTQLYALVSGEVPCIIGSAKPVDPDNGTEASYSLNMGTSDVLGIILSLRREGYVIRKSWF